MPNTRPPPKRCRVSLSHLFQVVNFLFYLSSILVGVIFPLQSHEVQFRVKYWGTGHEVNTCATATYASLTEAWLKLKSKWHMTGKALGKLILTCVPSSSDVLLDSSEGLATLYVLDAAVWSKITIVALSVLPLLANPAAMAALY